MFPTIDKKGTGIRLRKLMDQRGFSVKDVRRYLKLGSIQSVYHWLNGVSLPTVDNLYALSELLKVSVDEMLCGNRSDDTNKSSQSKRERLCAYYERILKCKAA